jgi:uncharacterized protein (TIGR02452 family)
VSLRETARETLRICETGHYVGPSGVRVELGDAVQRAVDGTCLYTPERLARILDARPWTRRDARTRIEVTAESTQAALQRLAPEGACGLVYASARNPGGGFLNGAKAQEEDVARCSALYPCLLTQSAYYEANRALDSMLYTDHVIHAPRVPFFRVRSRELIEPPFVASLIVAPAPNAGQALMRDPECGPSIERALRHRVHCVLAIAACEGHSTLVLGAWGCGVFRNDPSRVADAFGAALEEAFADVFARVVFAIVDRGRDRPTLEAFAGRLGGRSTDAERGDAYGVSCTVDARGREET